MSLTQGEVIVVGAARCLQGKVQVGAVVDGGAVVAVVIDDA